MRSAAVVKCAACMAPAVSQCRPEGSAQPFRPVCATSQCVAALIGLRLEEAQAALDAAKAVDPNPYESMDSPETVAAVNAARQAYDRCTIPLRQKYEEYLQYRAAQKSMPAPVFPGADMIMPIKLAVDQLHESMKDVDSARSPFGYTDSYKVFDPTYGAYMAIITQMRQFANELAALRYNVDVINKKYAENTAAGIRGLEAERKMREELHRLANGCYDATLNDDEASRQLVVTIRPFDPEKIRLARFREHRPRNRYDLETHKSNYNAVVRRERGPSAYVELLGSVSFRKNSAKNAYLISYSTDFDYAGYIKELVEDADGKVSDDIAADLRAHEGFLFIMPSRATYEWLADNAPRDLVRETIPIDAPATAQVQSGHGKRYRSIFTDPLTTKLIVDKASKMLYIYEVAINNALGSRKREADGGVSDAKRAAAAASV